MARANKQNSELDGLVDARDRRVSWTEVASLLKRSIDANASSKTDQRSRLLKEAAASSGYTAGALRRFLNTFEYLETLPFELRPDGNVAKKSFAAIEMIRRIAGHDAEEAKRLLGDLKKKRIPVSELRKALKDSKERSLSKERAVAEPRPVFFSDARIPGGAASERNWRVNAGLRLLSQLLPELTGKYESFQQPLGNAPIGVRCDAIAWLDAKWTKGDGFELLHGPTSVSKAVVSDRVTRAIVASRFFRRFYIVFTPDSSPERVHRAAQALEQLDARSVGVVWLRAEKPLIRPRSGPPSPDWTDKLALVCPGGGWDENFSLRSSRG